MVSLASLWLAILVAAVFVFVASSILHMLTPMHANDYTKLPDEDGVLDDLRGRGVTPGQYMFPRPASMKDMATPEMQAKFARGPVGSMIVLPQGGMNMGRSLLQWFVLSIVIGVFTAYIATLSLPAGADGSSVFRVTGAMAIAIYATSSIDESIWKGVRWSTTCKFIVDGVIYGIVTGLAFAWLWPGVA